KEFDLEGIAGTASGFHYEVKDIHLNRLTVANAAISVNNGIGITLNNLEVNLSCNWKYKKTKIGFPKGSGTAEATLKASTVGVTVAIETKTVGGKIKPYIRVLS